MGEEKVGWGRGVRRKHCAGFEVVVLEGQVLWLWVFDVTVYRRALVPSLELGCASSSVFCSPLSVSVLLLLSPKWH